MSEQLLATPLEAWHQAHQGRMVDFAGWNMPVQYTSIIEEHEATRQAIGLFDVSHMGRFEFLGDAAPQFLDRLLTRRFLGTGKGRIRYSLMCNSAGMILDDVLVYREPFVDTAASCSMVVNAGNRAKIAAWIEAELAGFDEGSVVFTDRTVETAMIAVQGPRANDIVKQFSDVDPDSLKYFTGTRFSMQGGTGLISRTGYTGEDGCELIVPAESAKSIWETIHEAGSEIGLKPCGLGARDTLRLEAAMPLYGHELSEQINAAQTGLGFALTLKDRDFIGRDAIVAAQQGDALSCRVGLELCGRRAAREGSAVILSDRTVGEVTSGTFSPTFNRPIAMAYVDPDAASVGTELEVDVRGKRLPAKVVALPFYART